MDKTFSCTACGAPNEPEPGATRMACSYCGVSLPIPARLQTQAKPQTLKPQVQYKPVIDLEKEAPEILRKAQPVVTKAWNLYAYWTWLRWLAPACLTLFILGFFLCAGLGALPFLLNLFN